MKVKTQDLVKYIGFIGIILLSFTGIYSVSIGGVNFSMYIIFGGFGILSFLFLKSNFLHIFDKKIVLLLLFMLFSSLINFQTVKLTSLFYSLLFIFYFLFYKEIIEQYINKSAVIKILKTILICYFVILIISQLLVLFDLITLTGEGSYFILKGPLGIIYERAKYAYRYTSLSSEPSYSSIIVLTAYYVLYNLVKENKEKIVYGILMLYMIISFRSAFGVVLLGMFFLSGLNMSRKQIFLACTLLFFLIFSFFIIDTGIASIERLKEIGSIILFGKNDFLKDLNLIDSSAFFRIAPFVYYLGEVNFLDYNFYIGHGANASQDFFSSLMFPNHPDMVFTPQLIPGFLYDYGVVGVILVYWGLIKTFVNRKSLLEIAIIIVVIFNSNFNTQVFWFVITCLLINNLFKFKK